MVKACSGGQEKLIHFGATGYGHNYSAAARKIVLEQDTSVDKLNQSLPQDIGLVKLYGLDQVVLQNLHQKIDKENISIFVINLKLLRIWFYKDTTHDRTR